VEVDRFKPKRPARPRPDSIGRVYVPTRAEETRDPDLETALSNPCDCVRLLFPWFRRGAHLTLATYEKQPCVWSRSVRRTAFCAPAMSRGWNWTLTSKQECHMDGDKYVSIYWIGWLYIELGRELVFSLPRHEYYYCMSILVFTSCSPAVTQVHP